MKLFKLLLAVVGATALLGALVGTASARNLSLSETTSTATFRRVEFIGGFATTRCNVTLTARFNARTIAKVAESVVGNITEANAAECESGSATVLRETLPWPIRYNGFTGTLPNISRINTRVIGASFRIREPVGFECLVRSTVERPAFGIYNREAGGRITSANIESASLPCSISTGRLSGSTTAITPSVTVTLI